jgi:hypothetical protein
MRFRPLMLAAITLFFAASGCAARVNKVMESWMGHNVSELIASWGPPQQTIDLGNQGRVYVWSAVRSFTTPGRANTTTTGSAVAFGNMATGSAYSTTTYTPPQTTSYAATRSFWVDHNTAGLGAGCSKPQQPPFRARPRVWGLPSRR